MTQLLQKYRHYFLLLMVLLLCISQSNQAFAATTPTPKLTPEPTINQPTESETTEKLKERIEKIVEEKRDQIEGTIQDLTGKKRGFIGKIQRVTAEAVTIVNAKGTHIIPLTESIQLVKAKKAIKPEEVAVDNWAMILGYQEDGAVSPRYMSISETSLAPKKPVVFLGTINKITATTMEVTARAATEPTTFTFAKSIDWQDSSGEATAKKNFVESLQVLVVGYADDEETTLLTTVRALAPFASPSGKR